MSRLEPLDVDDTSHCTHADRCASCGTAEADAELAVATVTTPVGVQCLTICGRCVKANRLPKQSYAAAMRRVLVHCEHLGCDLEDMADAIAESLR